LYPKHKNQNYKGDRLKVLTKKNRSPKRTKAREAAPTKDGGKREMRLEGPPCEKGCEGQGGGLLTTDPAATVRNNSLEQVMPYCRERRSGPERNHYRTMEAMTGQGLKKFTRLGGGWGVSENFKNENLALGKEISKIERV